MVIKVLNIVGARPQLMKASILSGIFSKSERFCEILVHTGQHYDANMSTSLMQELFIKTPDYQLNSRGKSELSMLADLMVSIGEIITKEAPNYVISYGDTTTTLAGALAARKLNINHIHVEAGVRNNDMSMPEEVNRILVDKISILNFCVTDHGVQNLLNEGHKKCSPFSSTIFSGDLMLDCYIAASKKVAINDAPLKSLLANGKDYVYATLHRQSNVDIDYTLREIVAAFNVINSEVSVVMPLHPRTKKMLEEFNLSFNFETIAPLKYAESIDLLHRSCCVITDSGGLVREAFFAKKPSLLLLEKPLWPEIEEVECSISTRNISCDHILQQYEKLKHVKGNFDVPVFGNGDAGQNIVRAIERHFDGELTTGFA
jgi:UDP-GlcNAc3NAcA epimerase